jgi:hypothetical protein
MGDIVIVFCPTLEMIADMHTKPKTGKTFVLLWNKATGNITIEVLRTLKIALYHMLLFLMIMKTGNR